MDRIYQGRSADFTARMAFAELAPIEIELIQLLAGESVWTDYLVEHGPGLHQIRFDVPEMEPIVEHLAEHGISVTQKASGIRPGTSWTNFDTERLVGFTVEVIGPVPGTHAGHRRLSLERLRVDSWITDLRPSHCLPLSPGP
jgi:methylmalonyl-CoA/ethylmalonyl-CoA epimerase